MNSGWREKRRGTRRDEANDDGGDEPGDDRRGRSEGERDSRDLTPIFETSSGGLRPPDSEADHRSAAGGDGSNAAGETAGAAIFRRASTAVVEALRERAVPFARTVRMCGVAGDEHAVFVDSHNEVWRLGDERVEPLCTPARLVTSLAAGDRRLFVGLADGTINELRDGELSELCRDDEGRPVAALAASHSGRRLLAATGEGRLSLGDLAEARSRWTTLHANRAVASVALSPCGSRLAAASTHGRVRITPTDSPGRALARIIVDARVLDMAFSTEGRLLAMLLDDGRLPIFRVADHRRLDELSLDDPRPLAVFFSDDDTLCGLIAASGRIGSLPLPD